MTAMQRIEPGTTPNTIDVDPHSKLSQVAFQGTVTGAHARATQVKIGFFPQNLAAPQPDDDHVCTMPLQEGSFLGFAKANVDLNSGDEYQLWGWVGHGNTWDGPHGLGTNYVSAAPDRRPPLLHVPLLNAVNALQLPRESLVEILHATMRLAAPRTGRHQSAICDRGFHSHSRRRRTEESDCRGQPRETGDCHGPAPECDDQSISGCHVPGRRNQRGQQRMDRHPNSPGGCRTQPR
jgi:hypothetical protein